MCLTTREYGVFFFCLSTGVPRHNAKVTDGSSTTVNHKHWLGKGLTRTQI